MSDVKRYWSSTEGMREARGAPGDIQGAWVRVEDYDRVASYAVALREATVEYFHACDLRIGFHEAGQKLLALAKNPLQGASIREDEDEAHDVSPPRNSEDVAGLAAHREISAGTTTQPPDHCVHETCTHDYVEWTNGLGQTGRRCSRCGSEFQSCTQRIRIETTVGGHLAVTLLPSGASALFRSTGEIGEALAHSLPNRFEAPIGECHQVGRNVEALVAPARELLALYDWRPEIAKLEATLKRDGTDAQDTVRDVRRMLREYGERKKAGWIALRAALANFEFVA